MDYSILYILDITINRFDIENFKKGFIPLEMEFIYNNLPKILEDKILMEKILYASMIGFIMYVIQCTRPDMTFTLCVSSRF